MTNETSDVVVVDDNDVDDDDDDDAVMGVGWLGSCWYDHWLVS